MSVLGTSVTNRQGTWFTAKRERYLGHTTMLYSPGKRVVSSTNLYSFCPVTRRKSCRAAQKGELEKTALADFAEFIVIVEDCQAARSLPDKPSTTLAGLLFATMHGLIALQESELMKPKESLRAEARSGA